MSDATPELAVAAKRIAALEADIASLRRGMLQHLTASDRLSGAALSLDADFFGGRFAARSGDELQSPLQKVQIATDVIAAVSEQLEGRSAFAESPRLKDQLASLAEALASLRGAAIAAERAGEEATGLPPRADLPAVELPEANPLAALAGAATAVRSAEGALGRIATRIAALKVLLAEAEAAVPVVDTARIAGEMAEELQKVHAEASGLRQAVIAEHDGAVRREQELAVEIARAHELASQVEQQRMADVAEIRALASEILAIVARDPISAADDETDISEQVLKEQLADPAATVAGICTAAESTIIAWQRARDQHAQLLTSRIDHGSQDLERSRRAVDEAKAETHRLTQSLQAAEAARSAAQEQIARLERSLSEIGAARISAEEERKAAQAQAAQAAQDGERARSELAEARAAEAKALLTVESARAEAATERSRAERIAGESQALVQAKSTEAANAAAALANAQAATARAEATAAQADAARARGEQAAADTERARQQLQAQLTQAQAALAQAEQERERTKAALARAQSDREADARRAQEQLDQYTARMAESSRSHGELKQIHARLAADHDRLTAELAAHKGAKADPAATAAWNRKLIEASSAAEEAQARTAAAESEAAALRNRLAAAEQAQAAAEERARRSVDRERRMEALLTQARAAVAAAARG